MTDIFCHSYWPPMFTPPNSLAILITHLFPNPLGQILIIRTETGRGIRHLASHQTRCGWGNTVQTHCQTHTKLQCNHSHQPGTKNHSPDCYCLLRSPCKPRLFGIWSRAHSSLCKSFQRAEQTLVQVPVNSSRVNLIQWNEFLLYPSCQVTSLLWGVSLWYRSLTCSLCSKSFTFNTNHLFMKGIHLQQF